MLDYGFCPGIPFSIAKTSKSPAATDFVEHMQRQITEARIVYKVASHRQKFYTDPHRNSVKFQPQQWVLLSSKNLRFKMGTPKLLPRWVRTSRVLKQVGKDAYELILPENWRIHDTFHVTQLAEYHSSGTYQPPPPAQLLEGELEYEVDCIVDHKVISSSSKGRPSCEYLVQWTGIDSDLSTREPKRN